ncbi:MAG: IPExxxVDY family protein [Flammeovirgaceae bacterium]|nr:IPExxxVDY family protein [Flammeovirgaceae bacterium]
MKKTKLEISYNFDFDLWGVVSAVKGHKLAWEFNQYLSLHLIKNPELSVENKSGEEKKFSFYEHKSHLNRLKLFKNKSVDDEQSNFYLLPEFPHYDFIILAHGEKENFRDQLMSKIKSIPSVQLVKQIPVRELKSKHNFIF